MIHVGIDLHHKMSYVRAITEKGIMLPGRRIDHSDLLELFQYISQCGPGPKRVVFEATANARWLQRQLAQDPEIEAVAVTPHKVRIIAETVAKTDHIDATVLADLSRMDALPRAWLPDEEVETLRELVRHRVALVHLRTRAKNQVNGVLVRLGILRPYGDIFGPRGRGWLAELTLPMIMRLQVDHWLELIDHYQKRILAVNRRLSGLARVPRWKKDMDLLLTMPGVGLITALTILGELGVYQRFRHRGEVSAFAGLVPTSKRSAERSRYGKITKRGSRCLRRILVEVSLAAARKVPRYMRLYLKLKPKNANIGKVAVARQMLEDAWTMLMKQEPFRYMEEARELTRVG